MPAPVETTNGKLPLQRDKLAEKLTGEPLTEGYRPTLPLWALFTSDTVPQFYLLRDIELMLIHPIVRSALEYFKGGLAGAEFWGGPKPEDPHDEVGLPISENPEVSAFVAEQCLRFWDRGVPQLQAGYEYGWCAGENLYAQEDGSGKLYWDGILQFSPRDVYLLTHNAVPVGVRVKQIANTQAELAGTTSSVGVADLWMASKDVPGKGMWYAHNPRYSQFYGQSQLLGAWRPWRRLGWKDGAESNIDLGFYRFWCRGPVVYFPDEDMQTGTAAPAMATAFDSQGRPRRFARDVARQLAEWYKSGAGVGLPSAKYSSDMGGGDKWKLELPDSTLNVEGGIVYAKHLWDQIRYGVGVPPELMESSEGGSGFNGRMVPLYAFLEQQQKIADALLLLFVRQVLIPLVRWNFGAVPWRVQVKPLLMTRLQAQKGEASQPANQGTPGAGPRGGDRGAPDFPALPNPQSQAAPQPPLSSSAPVKQQTMPNVGMSVEYERQRKEMARELARKIRSKGKAA